MNRYTYKGISKTTGEWVYGYYWEASNEHYIRYTNEENGMTDVRIILETLCQCTGISDKKGNMSFEYDKIKRLLWSDDLYNKTGDGKFYEEYYIVWVEELGLWGFTVNGVYGAGQELNKITNDFEIIGNKFDEVEE